MRGGPLALALRGSVKEERRNNEAIPEYTAMPILGVLMEDILRLAGPAAIRGVHWYPSGPPIQGLEFEVDMRGGPREVVLP